MSTEAATVKYEVDPELKALRDAMKPFAFHVDFTDFVLGPGQIAYEDDYLLVVDKPAGMLVHPTTQEEGTTLYDFVQAYYRGRGIEADIHPVLRLDRNTSGLVLFAKEPIVQFWLSQASLHKQYLAICEDHFAADRGSVEVPIARKPGSIIERCVDFSGRYARTDYEVLLRRHGRALVRLELFTGRTHQIRVHMAHVGCPLVNDNLYGTPGPQARHALHAYKLSFRHPVGDYPLEITRELPEELRRLLYA